MSYKAAYGNTSNVLLIDDIIRIAKGVSKSETFRLTPPSSPLVPSKLQAQTRNVNNNNKSINTNICNTAAPLPKEQYLTIHYAERVIKSEFDCNRWRVRTLTLFNADAHIISQWHALLTKRLSESKRFRVQRLLVFINPYGGRKMGLQTYERYCKPIFQLASIDAACIITQRANQIRDILMSHDLSVFDAVCCVGGDGTVAEVINGLIYRQMSDLGLDLQCPAYVPKPALPIGIIPAGSTDTVAYSVHGTSDVKTAALHLILGQRRGLDICSVWNRQGVIRFCASVLSYGYLGDVAAKSEKYRWMGTKRYEFTGVRAFLLNKGYEAEIRILESDNENEVNNHSPETICHANCQKCADALAAGSIMEEQSLSCNDDRPSSSNSSLKVLKSEKDFDLVTSEDNINIKEEKMQHSKTAEIEDILRNANNSSNLARCGSSLSSCSGNQSKWTSIKGKFFMISGANITCACTRSPNGIAKYSHLGDGNLDLILVRQTNMLNNIRFALNTMGRKGDIVSRIYCNVFF